MDFSIHFQSGSRETEAAITLGAIETFYPNLESFTQADYERQWNDAVRLCLRERKCVALFASAEIAKDGIGTLWLYPLIPSEIAGEVESARSRLEGFPSEEDAGAFIGERFMPVTIKASNFERRIYEWFEDGSRGDELALYYLDLSAPERFFGYIDHQMAHVSHWYVSNESLEKFLSTECPLRPQNRQSIKPPYIAHYQTNHRVSHPPQVPL